MDHFEVEVCKINQPLCLAAVKCLRLAEVGKVLMIHEYLYREGESMKVMSPGFQGSDDSKKFPVIDVVVSFGGGERLREVGAWMPFSIGVGLEKDGS